MLRNGDLPGASYCEFANDIYNTYCRVIDFVYLFIFVSENKAGGVALSGLSKSDTVLKAGVFFFLDCERLR